MNILCSTNLLLFPDVRFFDYQDAIEVSKDF